MDIDSSTPPAHSSELKRASSSSRQVRPKLERKGSSSKTRLATLALVGAGLRSVAGSPIGRIEDVGFASANGRLPWTPEDHFSTSTYSRDKRDKTAPVDWSDPANYVGVDWKDPKNYAGVNFNDPKLYLPAAASPTLPQKAPPVAVPKLAPATLEIWSALSGDRTSLNDVSAESLKVPLAHSLEDAPAVKFDAATRKTSAPSEPSFVVEKAVSGGVAMSFSSFPSAEATSTSFAATRSTPTRPASSPTIVTSSLASLVASEGASSTMLSATALTDSFAGIASTQNAILIVNAGVATATFSFWENHAAYQPDFNSAFTSVELAPGAQKAVTLPPFWSGRVQKMTGRVSDPATWGEITFDGAYQNTYLDVSYIRGYNAPLRITEESGALSLGSLSDLRVAAPSSVKTTDSGGTTVLEATEGYDGTIQQDAIDYERASNVGSSAYVVNNDDAATRGVASKHFIFTFG